MKIVVLDWRTMTMNGDISPEVLKQIGDTEIFDLTKPEDTAKRIGMADAVLCNKVLINREVIEQCPNLKYIGLFATGYNNVDIECAAEKGITVCNAGEYSTSAVAQQVFAYILDYYSRIRDYNNEVSAGKWIGSETFSYFPVPTHELYGKTLSVVGYGSIGRAAAKIGDAFGMRVLINTRTQPENCPYEVVDLNTAAEKADVITFHCPLTDKTKGMINNRLLSLMKPDSVLINTSRGGVVIEADLAAALNEGRIAAAYLDVLKTEPMSDNTPLADARNCIITPHTSWAALETRERLMNIVCDNLKSWMDGCPKNQVN